MPNPMNKLRTLGLPLATVLAAGLVGACGGDDPSGGSAANASGPEGGDATALSSEEYAREVEEVLEPLGPDLASLGDAISGSADAAALAEGIGEAQAELAGGAENLAAITPPEAVERIHEDLVAAIRGFADTLGATRTAAEEGNLEELQRTALELPGAAQAFAEELERVQRKAIAAGVPIDEATSSSE